MAEEKKAKVAAKKAPKLADPVAASIDPGTQEMIRRAQQLGIDTVFDRAEQMKPCAIGLQGICCKNCAMGPCRVPLPKGGIEGEDDSQRPLRRHGQHHCGP
jgi:carbon-monoxide dehydrogenase catalytic subunit